MENGRCSRRLLRAYPPPPMSSPGRGVAPPPRQAPAWTPGPGALPLPGCRHLPTCSLVTSLHAALEGGLSALGTGAGAADPG